MQLGPASKAKKKGGAGGGLKGMLSKKGPTPAAAVEESKGGDTYLVLGRVVLCIVLENLVNKVKQKEIKRREDGNGLGLYRR